jgi:hypothetical protein
MSEPVWNKFLTERDKAVFDASGYGAWGGFGKRQVDNHPWLAELRAILRSLGLRLLVSLITLLRITRRCTCRQRASSTKRCTCRQSPIRARS